MQAKGPDRSAVRSLALAGAVAAWTLAAAAHAQVPAAAPPAATANADSALNIEDPFEKTNRKFYAIHRAIDRAILKPLALGYEHKSPRSIQRVLHNFVTELGEPVVFGNDVLQLRIARAAKTAARFLFNATVGVGGLLDPATKVGLPHHDNSFGVTLGRYGVKPGPYIFLPLVGPSTLRDLIGTAVDFYSDPISRIHYPDRGYVQAGVWIIGGLDQRARAEGDLEQIDEMGTDPYATMRSLYLQNREGEIRGDQGVNIEDLPSFDEAPASPPAGTGPEATPAPQPQVAPEVQPTPAAPGQAPAATDQAVSAPSFARAQPLPADAGPDAAYFLAPPAPPASATPSPGPPLRL